MVAVTRQRRRARQRRTTIRRITSAIRTCSVLALILGVSIYLSQVPLSDAFFTAVQPVNPVSFKVTTEIRQATVNMAFGAAESRMATAADHLWAEITLINGDYDLARVNESTIEVMTEDLTVIPVMEAQPDSQVLRLRFSRHFLEQLLWHGSHNLAVTGEFLGGWVHFSGTGTLRVTIPAVVAVEELEAIPEVTQEQIAHVWEVVMGIDHPQAQHLVQRLNILEHRIMARIYAVHQYEIALQALVTAEESRTQEDYDKAARLIAELPEGEGKDALLLRLSEIKIAIPTPVGAGQPGGGLVEAPIPGNEVPPAEVDPEIGADAGTEPDNTFDGTDEDTEDPAEGVHDAPSDDDLIDDGATDTEPDDPGPLDDSDEAASEGEADTDDDSVHGGDPGDEVGSGIEIDNDTDPSTAANREDAFVEEEESEEKGD